MYHGDPQATAPAVIKKRLSFFSVFAMSLSAIIISVVVCASVIGVYALNIADRRIDTVGELIEQTVRSLPEVRKSLPPVLADAFNDERRPDYVDRLAITVRYVERGEGHRHRHRRRRTVVEVENTGDEVVSLLSMRIVGLDAQGDPIYERNTWAATPIQIEDDWRGPLLPHEKRRFAVWCYFHCDIAEVTHEITEVRTWLKDPPAAAETLPAQLTAAAG